MNYIINDNVEIIIVESNSKNTLESTTKSKSIKFKINFVKYNFKDTYEIKILDFDSYVQHKINHPTKEHYYFYPINNFFLYFYKGSIIKEQISIVLEDLIRKITAFSSKIQLNQEEEVELNKCIDEKKAYTATLMRPIRDFSLKMDSIGLYQGDYLENLSYSTMGDYMNRTDVLTELLYAYEIHSDQSKSFIKDLKNFYPKNKSFCEIYVYAKVSFKATVKSPPLPIYIGIKLLTLEKILSSLDNLISSLEIAPTIYTFNNFFALKTYDYSKMEYVIKQVVRLWTEAVPPQYLAERLANSFDIYSKNPLNGG